MGLVIDAMIAIHAMSCGAAHNDTTLSAIRSSIPLRPPAIVINLRLIGQNE
jgi:hypothetical protein